MMSKTERLKERVSALLSAAVREVLEAVRETVSEYEEKNAQTQRENQRLRRRVEELQEQLEQDSAVAQVTTCVPHTSSGHGEHSTLRCGEQSDMANTGTETKTALKEEPSLNSQADLCPPEIKTEIEHSDYPTTEEAVPQNNFYMPLPCADQNYHPAQNELPPGLQAPEVDFPAMAPCINPEALNAFAEPFSYEEEPNFAADCWRQRGSQQNREERHSCLLCGKTFTRLGNLRIHQRCHTGEKPYTCLHCGRRFSHSGNLQKHKRVHTGERPYRCQQCSKSFCQSSHLKKHQMIHTGRQMTAGRRNMEL